MRLVDELHSMKLYSSKNKVYIPFNPVNKKKGARITLLAPSLDTSIKMMNMKYMHNPSLYHGYYVQSRVSAYINSSGIINKEDMEEAEVSLMEALMHKAPNDKKRVYIDCDGSPNDKALLNEYFSTKEFKKYYKELGKPDYEWNSVTVYGFNSVNQLAKAVNGQSIIQHGDMVVTSYVSETEIFVLNRSAFQEVESKEIDYKAYCKNALITHVCVQAYGAGFELANAVGSALSGQADLVIDKYKEKFEEGSDASPPDNLTWARAIKALYDDKGYSGVKKLLRTKDVTILMPYVRKGAINGIIKLFSKNECTLLEGYAISDDKIVIGTDYHFIGYNDNQDKIILKPDNYIDSIIKKQNDLTGDDGIFIFLGDILYKGFHTEYEIPSEMKKEAIKKIKKLKGKYKILVKGNHDNLPDEFYLDCGFTHICSTLKYNNIVFTHQPETVKPGMINVHGHIHGLRTYIEQKPRYYYDVYVANKQHTDTLENILANQEEYEKTISQAKNIDRADPHLYIDGDKLELDDILKEHVIHGSFLDLNDVLNEKYLIDEKDIYYNKDKFDSGEINLCFITGHSGSGKSTMGSSMQSSDTDWINMDDCICVKDHFTLENLKEYSGLMYSFFTGKGKKWYLGNEDITDEFINKNHLHGDGVFEKKLYGDFIEHAISYAKSHKDRKFICEGIWIYIAAEPSKLKDVAVYIKGTSMLKSKIRANKRDLKEELGKEKGLINKAKRIAEVSKYTVFRFNQWTDAEPTINKYRKYFEKKVKTESTLLESDGTHLDASRVYLAMNSTDKYYLAGGVDFVNIPKNDFIYRHVIRDGIATIKGFIEVTHDYACPQRTGYTGSVIIGVHPRFRGQGIAKELVSTMLKELPKEHPEVNNLVWRAMSTNYASYKLAEKVGFKLSRKTDIQYLYRHEFKENKIYKLLDTKVLNERDLAKYIAKNFKCEDKDPSFADVKVRDIEDIARTKKGNSLDRAMLVSEYLNRMGIFNGIFAYMLNGSNDNRDIRKIIFSNVFTYNNTDWAIIDPDILDGRCSEFHSREWIEEVYFQHTQNGKYGKIADMGYTHTNYTYFASNQFYNDITSGVRVISDKFIDPEKFNIVEAAVIHESLYRFTYNNKGIYDELKKSMPLDEWKKLKNSNSLSWLPVPDVYDQSDIEYTSLFTDSGKRTFERKVMPIINKYLDSSKITLTKYDMRDSDDIAYSDKYQVVFPTSSVDSSLSVLESFTVQRNQRDKIIPLPNRIVTEEYMKEVEENGFTTGNSYLIDHENGMAWFFDENEVMLEANSSYDTLLRKYLYRERIKTNKNLLEIYSAVKNRNPDIKKTFIKLNLYKGFNIFEDVSYYNAIFLKNCTKIKDFGVNLYWEFLTRLLNPSEELQSMYPYNTIFIPIFGWDVKYGTDIWDYTKNLNPISVIFRMVRKHPEELKRWANRRILFIGDNGYFTVNFSNFDMSDLAKFKRFLTKLASGEDISDDEDTEESGYMKDNDSPAVITAKIVDKIEKNAGIKFDNISTAIKDPESMSIKSIRDIPNLRIRSYQIPIQFYSTGEIDEVPTGVGIAVLASDKDEFIKNTRSIISVPERLPAVYVP